MAVRPVHMVPGMNRHQSYQRDDQHSQQVGDGADDRFYPAAVVARIAHRDLSTIHRWCRIGYLVGAIRGTGPGRQPWLIPAAECHRVAAVVGASAGDRQSEGQP